MASQASGSSREAMAIRRAAYGDQHVDTARSISLLANCMTHQRKKHAEAEQLYTRALAVHEKYYTRQSDSVARTLFNMAHLACERADVLRAEELFGECLHIRKVRWLPPT
jgi:hypothetical protein